jgi:hypothetical protein
MPDEIVTVSKRNSNSRQTKQQQFHRDLLLFCRPTVTVFFVCLTDKIFLPYSRNSSPLLAEKSYNRLPKKPLMISTFVYYSFSNPSIIAFSPAFNAQENPSALRAPPLLGAFKYIGRVQACAEYISFTVTGYPSQERADVERVAGMVKG